MAAVPPIGDAGSILPALGIDPYSTQQPGSQSQNININIQEAAAAPAPASSSTDWLPLIVIGAVALVAVAAGGGGGGSVTKISMGNKRTAKSKPARKPK